MILTLLKAKGVILVIMSYLPGSCTDGQQDLPEAGISQSQDDGLTVEGVQLGPGEDGSKA